MQRSIALLVSLIVCACSGPSSWSIDTIATGDQAFDSARLRFSSSQAHPSLAFEMIRFGDQIEAFIHLNRFRFTSSEQVKILFTIGEEVFEDSVPVNEGAMRVRLIHKTTQKLIQALQEGRKVAILVDGFEETLDPNQFSSSFAKFAGEGHFLKGRN